MTEERTVRVERKDEVRATDSWLPQSSLPVPEPREGWVHRWVRTSSLGRADNTNVSRMMREGWVPVKAEDYPELQIMSDHDSLLREGDPRMPLLNPERSTKTSFGRS